FCTLVAAVAVLAALPVARRDLSAITSTTLFAQGPPATPKQDEQRVYEIKISGNTGARKVLAVPDFSAPGAAPDVQQAAKAIADVLWDDIDFEQEFTLVSHAAAAKLPVVESPDALPYDKWS